MTGPRQVIVGCDHCANKRGLTEDTLMLVGLLAGYARTDIMETGYLDTATWLQAVDAGDPGLFYGLVCALDRDQAGLFVDGPPRWRWEYRRRAAWRKAAAELGKIAPFDVQPNVPMGG